MWTGWVNLVVGVWTLISGFIQGLQGTTNLVIVGIVLAVLNFANRKRSTWQGTICGTAGFLLLVSGMAGLQSGTYLVVIGVLTMIFGILLGVKKTRRQQP